MRFSPDTRKLATIASVVVLAPVLGGCAMMGESKSPLDTPDLVDCYRLDNLKAQPGVTRDEILNLPGNTNDSCREADGSVRENIGGIG